MRPCHHARRALFVVAAFGWLACGRSPDAAAAAAAPSTHTVAIDGTQFQPAAITIKLGDTVEWVNKDPFPHTATSKAGAFDSQVIASGKSWRLTPSKRGEFSYTCTLHQTMKGTVRVE